MFSVTFQKTANPNIIYQEDHEMKKLLALTLAAVMTLALLAGCGGAPAPAQSYNQQLNAEMDKSNPPTLFVIGNQAGVKDWADYAVDLTGTAIANELNTDAYNLYDETGKLVSIGYCYECYGIIVNPDLVQQAGHSMDEIKDFASPTWPPAAMTPRRSSRTARPPSPCRAPGSMPATRKPCPTPP